MDITFINVGYGEALLIRENDFTMLIDGGDDSNEEYKAPGRVRCVDYLREAGVKHVDLMVNTHIHQDHTSGLTQVAGELPVGEFWTPFSPDIPDRDIPEAAENDRSTRMFIHSLNSYRQLMSLFASRGTPVRTLAARQDPVSLAEGITCDVLGPEPTIARNMSRDIERAFREKNPQPLLRDMDRRMNNASLILRLNYEGKHALLVGDTNRDGYTHLPPNDNMLKADVFKIGHHGQIDGINPEQLSRISPRYVAFTASSDRRYDSAHPQVVRLVQSLGATPLFTDNLPEYIQTPHSALRFTFSSQDVSWLYA